MNNALRIAQSIDSLPTISPSVSQVLQLSTDPTASAKEFEEIIKPDLALSANVLRLANSALFNRYGQITSVKQAIAMVGIRNLCNLVTSAGFLQIIPDEIAGYGIGARDFWQHSVAVATIAQQFDQELGLSLSEPVFLAGLLHDVGKLVVSSFLQRHNVGVCTEIWNSSKPVIQIESEVLGTDHCHVGSALSKLWKLPKAVQMATRWHHLTDVAPAKEQNLCSLIGLADSFARLSGYGCGEDELRRSVPQCFVDKFKIEKTLFEKVAAQSHQRIQTMTGIWTERMRDRAQGGAG